MIARSLLALASVFVGTCTIEGPEACDEHQVFERGGAALEYAVCVCNESDGWVFDEQKGHGCRQCSEGQTIVGSRCTTVLPDAGASAGDGAITASPTGVGAYCDSDADCAAYDAKYCAVQTHTCLIARCATGENACPSGASCCDYSALLAGLSLCLANDQLADGKCPMGGTRVSP